MLDWAVVGWVASSLSFAVGIAIWWSGRGHPGNGTLSSILILEGFTVGALAGLYALSGAPAELAEGFAWAGVAAIFAVSASLLVLPFLYLRVAGVLLDIPLARFLARRRIHWALGLALVGAFVLTLNDIISAEALLLSVVFMPVAALLMAGIAAVLQWTRSTPGTSHHKRARLLMFSHGLRLLFWGSLILIPMAMELTDPGLPTWAEDALLRVWFVGLPVGFVFVNVPLVMVAVFRGEVTQVRHRLRRGTLYGFMATLFTSVFLLLERALSDQVTTALVAVVVTHVLSRNLDRIAQRAADFLLGETLDPLKEIDPRKVETYRGAVEVAFADGFLNRKERDALRLLQTRLGLSEDEALTIQDYVGESLREENPTALQGSSPRSLDTAPNPGVGPAQHRDGTDYSEAVGAPPVAAQQR